MRHEDCDVWLLTEVHVEASVPGMHVWRTGELMGPRKSWAAVLSKVDGVAHPDPHRATASVHVGDFRFMSSVLPWRGCGSSWPGSGLAEKVRCTLDRLQPHVDQATVWGGDWNQALEGIEYAGTREGRNQILEVTAGAHLCVPTRSLGSASPGHRTIDHIAVPVGWDVSSAHRVSAAADRRRLSDHDLYVISVDC